MTNELAPVPLSLFHLTGEMRKTNKSDLLDELQIKESNRNVLDLTAPEKSLTIIDFMAVVQSTTKGGLKTFEDLSERIKSTISQ